MSFEHVFHVTAYYIDIVELVVATHCFHLVISITFGFGEPCLFFSWLG
jgi:hypothetical protein